MPTTTYTPIASVTLSASASEVVFSGLPQTFRDLVIVVNGTLNSFNAVGLRFNGDSGSNYPQVTMFGDGTNPGSTQSTEIAAFIGIMGTAQSNIVATVMDYSATDKQKTLLGRGNASNTQVRAVASRWANTSAITSAQLHFFGSTLSSGAVVSLWGIAG